MCDLALGSTVNNMTILMKMMMVVVVVLLNQHIDYATPTLILTYSPTKGSGL